MFPDFAWDLCADVAVVFGAGYVSGHIVKKAIELYNNEQVKDILLCGGPIINRLSATELHKKLYSTDELLVPLDAEREANYMARYLKDAGIPAKHYFIENASTNTAENIRNAAKFEVFKRAESVHLIAYTPTRSLMTFRREEEVARQNGGDAARKIVTLSGVIPLRSGDVTATNWKRNTTSKKIITDNFNKLAQYIKAGFCKDTDLAREIRLAGSLPHLPRLPEVASGNGSPCKQFTFGLT